jgi:hypothetical protein
LSSQSERAPCGAFRIDRTTRSSVVIERSEGSEPEEALLALCKAFKQAASMNQNRWSTLARLGRLWHRFGVIGASRRNHSSCATGQVIVGQL